GPNGIALLVAPLWPSSVTAFEGPNGIALLVAPLWPSSVTAFEGPNGIALLVAPLWPSSVTAFVGPNGIALLVAPLWPSSVTAFGRAPMVLLFWWRLCGPSSVTAFGGPNGIALHDASGCPSNKYWGKLEDTAFGVAATIMSKIGYREGSGLGAKEQGISRALQVQRTGGNVGLIVGEEKASAAITSLSEEGRGRGSTLHIKKQSILF
uniref:G-patch domain-containing protein n=1 Tax=Meloidogyne incognita TaxID=6306 RepID=A0A914L2N9_MELIC